MLRNSSEKIYAGVICILLIVSYFINLGEVPLWLEEPRRAMISLEMLYNDNLWVPTEFGEFYYKKPPLWNWVLIGAYNIFGGPTEFAIRFFSVLSFLFMGVAVYWMGKKYVDMRFGIQSALLFLVSVDIYFYFSLLGEIDLFYSLLTLLSFFSIYHFGIQRKWFLLFAATYFFGALGVLTKGLPSFPFLAISLLTYFIYIKAFKRLFHWQHFAGLGLFLLIIGGYLYMYDQYNPAINFVKPEESVLSQSTERTVFNMGILPMLKHMIIFPLNTLKNILPAALLLPFLIRKDIFRVLKENSFIACCALLFISNISIYWISPGTTSRYVYMMYPLLIIVFLYAFHTYNPGDESPKWHILVYKVGVWVVLAALLLGVSALPFVPFIKKNVDNIILIAILSAIVFAGLMWFYHKKPAWAIYHLIAAFIAARFIFNVVVVPLRLDGELALSEVELKKAGIHIAEINNDLPVYIWKNIHVPHTFAFYFEREEEQILRRTHEINPQHYYIAKEGTDLPGTEQVYAFSKGHRKYVVLLKK